jgi:hypothetical protein
MQVSAVSLVHSSSVAVAVADLSAQIRNLARIRELIGHRSGTLCLTRALKNALRGRRRRRASPLRWFRQGRLTLVISPDPENLSGRFARIAGQFEIFEVAAGSSE